jgi:hypothetical protein
MAQQFPSALNPRVGPVDLEFSTYDAAVAAGQDAFATNPLQSALSYFDLRAARKDEDAVALSLSEQSLIIEDAGLIDVLKPEEGETDRSLNMLIDMKREELARQTVMANAREGITSSAAMLGSGLFASLLDPINAAVGFVPLCSDVATARDNVGPVFCPRKGRCSRRCGCDRCRRTAGVLHRARPTSGLHCLRHVCEPGFWHSSRRRVGRRRRLFQRQIVTNRHTKTGCASNRQRHARGAANSFQFSSRAIS